MNVTWLGRTASVSYLALLALSVLWEGWLAPADRKSVV